MNGFGRLVRRAAAGLALACTGAAAAAAPAPLVLDREEAPSMLSDSAGGVTCDYYVGIARLSWQRMGGDWIDQSGEPYGDTPFSSMGMTRNMNLVPFALDLTTLAKRWKRGDVVPGAVLLRAFSGNGIADIASRESPQVLQRPALVVTWDDGHRELLDPLADTFTACPTKGSLGGQPIVRAGGPNVALLSFPVPDRPGRRAVSVMLQLTAQRIWAPLTLGAFAVRTPATQPVPITKGLAEQAHADVGLEKQPDVLFVERFDDENWTRSWRRGERVQPYGLATTEAGFEPLQRSALKVAMESGDFVGLDFNLPLKGLAGGTEPDELYLRYYLRFGSDWDPADVGKLPGLAGTYGRGGWGGRTADGYNGWSARGGFYKHLADDTVVAQRRGVGTYVYHVDAREGGYGELVGWNRGPTGMLDKNRWYCIEQHVRLNTPGKNDGVVRGWVDGRLAYVRSDLLFRKSPDLHIETAWLDVYHGGKVPAPHRMTLYLDNLVVARRYIGPMGP